MIKKAGRYENWILSFIIVGLSALLMGVFFDFYYDLNDDTMMRDIMSGIYSGTPDGHNMQTLYPLGAAVALCYRINGSFPWYGAFLFLCQFGCFFAVGVRLCALADALAKKLLCLSGLVLFQWGIWLIHMVNVQYTITCGMLVGTAVFLFLTIPRTAKRHVPEAVSAAPSAGSFLIQSLLPLLFFLLAFQLRSEMALLVLPFLGLAGVFCWWEERPVFTGKNLKKYGGLFLLLLAGMGLIMGADALAYGGEWAEFRQFFDDRTTIYDFYPEVVTENRFDEDLDELGVGSGARILLENYNYGLDEEIDAQMLSDVAAYAKEHVGGGRDWGKIFKEKLLLYRYRSFHREDAPYNLLVLLGYVTNIIAAVMIYRRRFRNLFGAAAQLSLIFLVRSALWMFILMRGRDPERITHPLYLAEFCLLAGLFVRRSACGAVSVSESAAPAHGFCGFLAARRILFCAAAAVCLLSVAGMVKSVPAVRADQIRRQEANAGWEAIDAYCRARQGVFFFEDVYSTVAFSGKLLERRDSTLANYDIAGGWMCKSPLCREKLAVFGIEDAADALLSGNAYFILSDEERELRGLDWLAEFYAGKGVDVEISESRIGENYGVYRIRVALKEDGGRTEG